VASLGTAGRLRLRSLAASPALPVVALDHLPDRSNPVPSFDQAAWREEFPLLARAIPMNNCSQGPQSRRARAAAVAFLDSWNERGMDWDAWLETVQLARATFARVIGATAADIAIFASVSDAASAAMSALRFADGRTTIVATAGEFPTIGHVALAQAPRGAQVRWVPVRDGAIDATAWGAALRDDVRVACATHAWYQTGALQDIPSIARQAHDAGALLLVDAYQSAGVIPIDVRAWGVDFLVAGTQKYLLGTPGIAFLYVRPGLAEDLAPVVTGWFGRANPFAFDAQRLDWGAGAARFDTGTPPVLAASVAAAAMTPVLEVGIPAVREWTIHLSRRLVEGAEARGLAVVGPRDPAARTPTTAIAVDGDSAAIERAMRAGGVIASARGPVIRLAPHFFTTLADCDRALDVLAAAVAP
jgi:selenocysteine lyase/cysteine desulfurase